MVLKQCTASGLAGRSGLTVHVPVVEGSCTESDSATVPGNQNKALTPHLSKQALIENSFYMNHFASEVQGVNSIQCVFCLCERVIPAKHGTTPRTLYMPAH